MATIEQLDQIKIGDTFSLDLTELAQAFLSTDEWGEYCHDGGYLNLDDGKQLRFEVNGDNIDDPYIDLYIDGDMVQCDGEVAEVIYNTNNYIGFYNEDSNKEFMFDYGMACPLVHID